MSLYDRDYMRDDAPSFLERLQRIQAFHWLFGANLAVFVVQWLFLAEAGSARTYIPAGGVSLSALSDGKLWTPFTYMFVHGSVGHILLNMIMLWFAGKRVQDLYGQRHFVMIYVVSGLAGAALQLAVASTTPMGDAYLMGASASIMGLMLALAIAMPAEEIYLLVMFIIPVRFRLWTLAKVLLFFNLGMGVLEMLGALPGWLAGDGAAVAYLAHFGGALAGWHYARTLGQGDMVSLLPMQASNFRSRLRRRALAAQQAHSSRRLDGQNSFLELAKETSTRAGNAAPSVDLIKDEVDPILDKINELGFSSLTDDERRTLERASRQISDKTSLGDT
jgi:membrane associated rhomboid family serine protease